MDESALFDKLKNLLGLHPLTITEICDRLDKTHKEVLNILVSNPYCFDYRMNHGTKMWKTFEE